MTSEQKTVLVVDDEEFLRDAIAFDFKRKGFRVFTAENGLKAFDIVRSENIDVVITDIRMPNGDGVQLLGRIKEFKFRIPVVIFLTGFSDLTLEDLYDKGANVILSKPFDRKVLFEAVQSSLIDFDQRFMKPVPEDSPKVTVKLQAGSLQDTVDGKILSWGKGGFFLSLDRFNANEPIRLNQWMHFKIEAPEKGKQILDGYGVVRWVREGGSEEFPDGIGLELVFIDESCRKDVLQYLESLGTRAFIPKK